MDSRSELKRKVSNWWQLGGLQRSRLVGGKGDGVEVIDFRTGGGLRLQILAGRGMDAGLAEFRGTPLSWMSPAGVVHPGYFRPQGIDFLESCAGGLFFTCGLTQVGAPCEDQGEQLALHGNIANTPAEEIQCRSCWEGDRYLIEAKGEVREASPLKHHLLLRRSYRCYLGENQIRISDRVRNEGSTTAPHMLLYHFNFGYPLLDSGSRILLPSRDVRPRDEAAAAGLETWSRISAPATGFSEQVFYHELGSDPELRTCAAVVNPQLELAATIRFDRRQLDRFVQWKCLNDQIYAIGLEPSNCTVQGRAHDRAEGILQHLEPGEERSYDLEFEVLSGAPAIAHIEQTIQEMKNAENHVR